MQASQQASSQAPLRPHATVATCLAGDRDRLLAALQELPADVDVAEVRLDGLWKGVPDVDRATDDLLAIAEAGQQSGRTLLATLRPRRQGGQFEGPENVRLGLLQAAARAGFQAVDLEMDGLDMAAEAAAFRPLANVVLSQHLGGPAPCRSDGLQALLAMQDLAAAYDKLAFTASAYPDLLRCLEFVHAHHQRGGKPCVTTMQHGGAPLRAAAALAGNRATYGHASGLPPAVPGQPALADIQAIWHHWGLTPDDLDAAARGPAKWLAVLGTPVMHSRSPRLHNAFLRGAGRPERFGALEVPASASALRLTFHAAHRIGLVGASVTNPHKLDAARIAQGDAIVQAVGAANCVRFEPDGSAVATNTDATAIRRLAAPHCKAGAHALVLGAGGAARAAVHALAALGAQVTVAARDPVKAAPLAALGAHVVPWTDATQARPEILVQATTIGSAASDPSPVPASVLDGKPWVLEMVYAAGPTALQRDAAAAGCAVTSGLQLLEEQGRDAFTFWFGQPPPAGAGA